MISVLWPVPGVASGGHRVERYRRVEEQPLLGRSGCRVRRVDRAGADDGGRGLHRESVALRSFTSDRVVAPCCIKTGFKDLWR